jgi:hypothetical protein
MNSNNKIQAIQVDELTVELVQQIKKFDEVYTNLNKLLGKKYGSQADEVIEKYLGEDWQTARESLEHLMQMVVMENLLTSDYSVM